jgi:hypothetical protein
MKRFPIFLAALVAILLLTVLAPRATAADDYGLRVTLTNSAVSSSNSTAAIDLGSTNTAQIGTYAYLKAEIPALTLATNSATVLTYNLQHSTASGSGFADTNPKIEYRITGGSSATNTATTVALPIPRNVNRYIRVMQQVPAAAGDITSKTNVYTLVVP